jgi:importin-4
MRKRVSQNSGDFWISLPQDEREAIKAKLPELVIYDRRCAVFYHQVCGYANQIFSSNLVRHSTARVIAAIAGIEVPVGSWNQLLPFLHQTSTSTEVAHREVGSYILYTVLESIVEGFQQHLQSLFQLFEQLLQDPESIEVRVTTVRSLGVIAQYIDAEEKADIVCQLNHLISQLS